MPPVFIQVKVKSRRVYSFCLVGRRQSAAEERRGNCAARINERNRKECRRRVSRSHLWNFVSGNVRKLSKFLSAWQMYNEEYEGQIFWTRRAGEVGASFLKSSIYSHLLSLSFESDSAVQMLSNIRCTSLRSKCQGRNRAGTELDVRRAESHADIVVSIVWTI